MPASVYVWSFDGTKSNWGHVSLELSDGTYISWWPRSGLKSVNALSKVYARPNYSKQSDIKAECAQPTYTIHKYLKDENAIKHWWKEFRKSGSYCAAGMNCAKVVYTALKQGGAKFKGHKLIWTPDDIVKNLCKPYLVKNT
eukprot:UN04569